MSDRISLDEFERLLADDSTSDEQLARYVKLASVPGRPMSPTFALDESMVEVPPSRGLFSLAVNLLNERGERRRIKAYEERIAAGWKGLRFLAEGDSWFLYPLLLNDVIDWLDVDYAIYSVAAAGDTLENMLAGIDRLEDLIDKHKFDGLIFSGGGNDIAGDPLVRYLLEVAAQQEPPDHYLGEEFNQFLAKAEAQYDTLFRRLTSRFPDLRIFCHGYDWPFPRTNGPWLWPAMLARHVPESLRAGILHLMIDRFYASLAKVAGHYKDRVFLVDCRGVVGPQPQWYDELHPNDPGFSRVAQCFRKAISAQFPERTLRGGLKRMMRLSWHPHEDPSGMRVQSKVIPAGASVSIGRHQDREILLLDDWRVSRNHARVLAGEQSAIIEDLGSSNGTMLEGARIARALWRPGQEVRIGNFKLQLELVAAEPEAVTEPPLNGSHGGRGQTPGPALADAIVNGAAAPQKQLQRLEIELACGSLVNVAAPAYLVGIFHHVRPTASLGAAREIDLLIDERMSGLLQSGIFGTDVGEISTVPVPERNLKADTIVFAGLGSITSFGPKCLEVVGKNLVRMLAAANITSFATVPIGANTGCSISDSVTNLMQGIVEGLAEVGPGEALTKITLCEIDETRYAELAREMRKLAAGGLFREHGLELSLKESSVNRSAPHPANERATLSQILVHATSAGSGQYQYFTLPMIGAGLPVWTQLVDAVKLDELTRVVDEQVTDFDAALGASLASLYLPAAVQDMLAAKLEDPSSYLLVIHDRGASSIPWEALYFKGRCPALECGITRKCLVQPSRPSRGPLPRELLLRMLVVYPHYASGCGLAPLPGAEQEGALLAQLFKENNGEVTILSGEEATKERILNELNTGNHTILHYAGHAWFSEANPRESGLLLSHNERITAADLDSTLYTPKLIFLNACESSRMRGASPGLRLQRGRIEASGGLAEGLLSIGVENLVGTYWEVDDAAAQLFAQTFYSRLLRGEPMSTALRDARRTLKEHGQAGNRMWANYLHFGDPIDKLRSAPAS